MTAEVVTIGEAMVVLFPGRHLPLAEAGTFGSDVGGAEFNLATSVARLGVGAGWVSRLGVRLHRTWVDDSGRKAQPYLTLNWWHDKTDNQMSFNAIALKDLYPSNRYEAKLGVNADLARGWTAWGNVGYQWGGQDYRAASVRLGAKYTW